MLGTGATGPERGFHTLELMPNPPQNLSLIFIELGTALVAFAILERIAGRRGFSAIPLYLLAGCAFGRDSLLPLGFSQHFIQIGGEVGVLLLLFMLGLEYTGKQLTDNLQVGLPVGLVDLALNFTPGLLLGLLLGWTPLTAALLGGVTWISSSGVIAKVFSELRRLDNLETRSIVSVLVFEDLAMAIYLPLAAALLVGGGAGQVIANISAALFAVSLVLFVSLRYGTVISAWIAGESYEIIVLTTFGAVLLAAGIAQRLQVSAAIGAFLVGIALSGPIVKQSKPLLSPLRNFIAAIFFFFFGLQIHPATLPSVIVLAVGLGLITGLTKVVTGYSAARRSGIDRGGRLRAGVALIPRGEFSLVIAGLGSNLEPQLGPLAAAYVLFTAVLGPILMKIVK